MTKYEENLNWLRHSTNIISCSWSMRYKQEFMIHGARYNETEIITITRDTADGGYETIGYTKSLVQAKRRINSLIWERCQALAKPLPVHLSKTSKGVITIRWQGLNVVHGRNIEKALGWLEFQHEQRGQ